MTGVPVGQQISEAVNTTFNALFTQLGGAPANPISGLLEGALVLVRRTVFGLVPTGVSATLNGSALEITVDPGSTAYFRQDGASLQVSGDPVFFRVLNEQQFSASSVQTVTATGTGHAGLVFTTGDVNASLDTTGIDSVNFGAGAQFGDSVTATLDSGTLVLYNAVRGMTGVTLDAPQIQLATNVDVEASSLTGTGPDVRFTGTVDAKAAGKQSLTVTALGTTTFEGAVGSQAALGSLLTRGIAPLSIPQSSDSQTIPLYYMPQYSPSGLGPVKTGIPVAVGNNAPRFYTFDTGGTSFIAGYSTNGWQGVGPPVGPGPIGVSYNNGNFLDGVALTTPITIGAGANSVTTNPIQLGAMTSGGNSKLKQTYDFSNPDAGPLNGRFFGDFGGNFNQLVVPGQSQQMASALFQLPGNLSTGFLVHLGPIGTPGELTVGATPALVEQFPYAISVAQNPDQPPYPGPNDYPALQMWGFNGDYSVTDGGVEQSLGSMVTIFDTGGPSTSVRTDTKPTFYQADPQCKVSPTNGCGLKPGTTFTGQFANAKDPGNPLVWSFTVGFQPAVNKVAYATGGPLGTPNVNTGLNLFNEFDVLFDVSDKKIYLRPNGGQATVILASSVNTAGAQLYQQGNVTLDGNYTTQGGAVSVAGTTTLAGDTQITTGSGAVTFSGTIDGANSDVAPTLTVNTTGATTFVRAVGWISPLASVTTTGGGSTATSSVTTNRSQVYGGDVSLNGPYSVSGAGNSFTVAGATTISGPVSLSTGGGDVSFNGPVDSLANKGFPLTVAAGATGSIVFQGAVGATNPLGGLAIYSAELVSAFGSISLDGSLGYSAAQGLQIGGIGDGDYVGGTNFTAGGSILGFQINGGSNFGITNGSATGVGCNDVTPGACGSGVVIEGGSRATIQGFGIANNASDGVFVADGTNLTVTGNSIFNNAGDGVGVMGVSTNNDISSNTISRNTGNGVNLGTGSTGNTILSNTITYNTANGVHLEGSSSNTISNNTINYNGCGCVDPAPGTGDGVLVTGASASNAFTNNTISNSTVDGVGVTGASSDNTFINNIIFNNSGYGVIVSGSGTVGNAILSNSIYLNSDPGIVLSDGGNAEQPTPDVVTAELQGSAISVSGTVTASEGYSGLFQVQVFGIQSNVQQGKQLLGSSDVSAGAFTLTVSQGTWPVGATTYVTVTATPVDGRQSTSEFSTAAQVT